MVNVENNNLIITITPDQLQAMLEYVEGTSFVSEEDQQLSEGSFDHLATIKDINKFLPIVAQYLQSEDAVSITPVIRTVISAAENAIDNGDIDGLHFKED